MRVLMAAILILVIVVPATGQPDKGDWRDPDWQRKFSDGYYDARQGYGYCDDTIDQGYWYGYSAGRQDREIEEINKLIKDLDRRRGYGNQSW